MTVTKRELIKAGFDKLDMDAVIYIDDGISATECTRVTVVTDSALQTERGEISTTLSDEPLPVGSLVLHY